MKKVITTFCLIVLMVSLLSGCGKEVKNTDTKTKNLTRETEKIKLRFSWWGGEERHKATLELVKLYEKLNPNVEIDTEYSGFDGYYQKLATQLGGGTAPDIMQIDQPWIYEFNKDSEIFADMTDINGIIDFSAFDKKFIKDFCTVGDKIVGLPTGVNGLIVVQNDDLLKKAGIDSNIVWNWENILTQGKKFHEKLGDDYYLGITDVAALQKFHVQKYVVQKTGKKFINDDYTLGFTEKELTEAYKYILKLMDNNVFVPAKEIVSYDSKIHEHPKWINGKVGLSITWASMIPAFVTGYKDTYSSSRIPMIDGTENSGIVVRPSQLLSINKKSKNAEEAAKFVEFFLNNKDAVLTLGTVRGIPASSKAKQSLLEANKITKIENDGVNIALKDAGIKQSSIITNPEVQQLLDDMVENIIFKVLTPEEGAKQLIKDLTNLLADIK